MSPLQSEKPASLAIERALSDSQIRATFPLMRQLRSTLSEGEYLPRVRRMQASCGFALAALSLDKEIKAVAGYRISESLAWGKFLYIDDLVSAESERSKGYGGALLRWLEEEARANGCSELHLDSGTQRLAAHRFYLANKMDIVFFHFKKAL